MSSTTPIHSSSKSPNIPILPVHPTPQIAVTPSEKICPSAYNIEKLPPILSPAGHRRDLRSLSLQGRDIEPLIHFRR